MKPCYLLSGAEESRSPRVGLCAGGRGSAVALCPVAHPRAFSLLLTVCAVWLFRSGMSPGGEDELRKAASRPDWVIVFESHRDGNAEVYAMTRDGSAVKNLSRDPRGDGSPKWSPDGRRVAFSSNRYGKAEIIVYDMAGGDWQRITESQDLEKDRILTWTRDGQGVVFSGEREGTPEVSGIYEARVGGGMKVREVLSGVGDYAVWDTSPTTGRVLCTLKVGSRSDILELNVETGGTRKLVADGHCNFKPKFSPDGSRFAFASDRSGTFDLYVCAASGDGLERITVDDQLDCGGLYWSRDGKCIGFTSRATGNCDACVVEVDTRRKWTVFGSKEYDEFYGFTEDDWCLIVSDIALPLPQIFLVDKEGRKRIRLTKTRTVETDPDYFRPVRSFLGSGPAETPQGASGR